MASGATNHTRALVYTKRLSSVLLSPLVTILKTALSDFNSTVFWGSSLRRNTRVVLLDSHFTSVTCAVFACTMPGEKKDAATPVKDDKGDKASKIKSTPKAEEPKPLTPSQRLKANLDGIVKATETHSLGPILRVLRRTNNIRKTLPSSELLRFVEKYVSQDSAVKRLLVESAQTLESDSQSASDNKNIEELGDLTGATRQHPEVEAYLSNIIINKLVEASHVSAASKLADKVLAYYSKFNRRTLDMFTSQTISFLSLAHQKLGTLTSIRHFLLKAHRSACLQHNEFGQATIINLLLHNYLNDNLYDQAAKLVEKVNFPEHASVNQYVRYLYFCGRIQCVQLEYTESYSNLNQAYRKAPQNTGVGFRTAVTKLSIIVQLLMGDIPERSLFSESSTAEAVAPYLELTQVRLENHAKTTLSHSSVFFF